MLYNILIPILMFLYSIDGYNTINYFRLWLQYRQALKGAAA